MKRAPVEALLLAACAAVCASQLLLPGFIGIANNGDFSKVSGRFDIGPPDGGARNFIYFVPAYQYGPQYHWVSDVLSSEILLAAGPILLARAAGAHSFDIRWLGALHALLFMAAFYALLVYLRRFGPLLQLVLGALAIWIFADVAYLAYCNSFYSDTPAILGLLLMVPLALHLAAGPRPQRATLWLFAAAAALFITSKFQHGIFAFLPALYALSVSRRSKASGIAVCVFLLAAGAATFLATSADYQAHPLFTVIFFKIAPASPAPREALRQLGLGESDAPYIGKNAYSQGSPVLDRRWIADFTRRASYRRVLAYWLRHPRQALAALGHDLTINAPLIRPPNLSNFQPSDGRPPGALTSRFASWSALRAWLLVLWPRHIVVWYVLLAGACGLVLARRPAARLPAAVCLGIALMAVSEFVFASLTDAIETYRHLLLFHLMTDITICFAAGWLAHTLIPGRRPLPSPALPSPGSPRF